LTIGVGVSVVPDYEFKCGKCSIVLVQNMLVTEVHEEPVLWCPRCRKTAMFHRIYGFGIPGGGSGERPRSS
jgi:hypothetical protein